MKSELETWYFQDCCCWNSSWRGACCCLRFMNINYGLLECLLSAKTEPLTLWPYQLLAWNYPTQHLNLLAGLHWIWNSKSVCPMRLQFWFELWRVNVTIYVSLTKWFSRFLTLPRLDLGEEQKVWRLNTNISCPHLPQEIFLLKHLKYFSTNIRL